MDSYNAEDLFKRRPSEHPSPQVDPPHHNVISISFGTGNLRNMITRPSQAPPPPPLPNVGPPRIHTGAEVHIKNGAQSLTTMKRHHNHILLHMLHLDMNRENL